LQTLQEALREKMRLGDGAIRRLGNPALEAVANPSRGVVREKAMGIANLCAQFHAIRRQGERAKKKENG